MKRRLYLKVSLDQYELPEAVADNVKELAGMVGTNPNTIKSLISKYEHGLIRHSPYRRIILDDKEIAWK